MRKIQTQDVFKLARIMKQTNIKTILSSYINKGATLGKKKEGATKEEQDTTKQEFGIEVAFSVLEACAETKTEGLLYDLLGGIAEKKANEIKEQSLETTIEQIKQIIKENDITTFFNTASRLTI